MRAILVILWFAFWPISEVFGTPEEAEHHLPWKFVGIVLLLMMVWLVYVYVMMASA